MTPFGLVLAILTVGVLWKLSTYGEHQPTVTWHVLRFRAAQKGERREPVKWYAYSFDRATCGCTYIGPMSYWRVLGIVLYRNLRGVRP